MRVLIVGSGMVGCFLAKELCDAGDQVTLFDVSPNPGYIDAIVGAGRAGVVRGTVVNLSDVLRAVQACAAERIVHTAALLGGSINQVPYTGVQVNVVGTMNVIEAAHLASLDRVVYTSTGGVYDRRASGPMPESHRKGPGGLYAATKIAAEVVGRQYAQLCGIQFIAVRYPTGFGPTCAAQGSIYGRVIEEIVRAAVEGRALHVEREGPFRYATEYLYAADMAHGAVLALKAERLSDNVFNVGAGVVSHLEDLVDAVRQAVPSARIEVSGAKADDARYPFDLSRAAAQLGYRPAYSLVDGMRAYVETWPRMPHAGAPRAGAG